MHQNEIWSSTKWNLSIFYKKKDGLDVKIMFRENLHTVLSSILKEENFHPRNENLEQPHMMINMKGETIPLSKQSVKESLGKAI